MQKVRGRPDGQVAPAITGLPPPVDIRFQGLFHSPHRGAFHLSLTVLVHYRWPGVFSLGGWSPLIPPGFLVSQGTWVPPQSHPTVPYRTVTVSGPAFQRSSSGEVVAHSVAGLLPRPEGPTTPLPQRQQASSRQRFGLFPVRSPLLGESRLISLPRGTKMFQFPRFPTRSPPSQEGCRRSALRRGGVPPFGHLRITACSPLPGAVSPCAAPFVGSWPQGIHRPPSVA